MRVLFSWPTSKLTVSVLHPYHHHPRNTQREAEHHIWALRRHWIGFSSLWISLLSSLPTSNWVLFARRKSTPGGTQSLPASDWVLFLVDFFGGHGLLFLKTSIRVGEEWIKEKEKEKKNATLKYFQLSYSSQPQK